MLKVVGRSGGRAVGDFLQRGVATALVVCVALALRPPDRLTAQAPGTVPYFQQDVHYTIRAALDEPSGVLVAAGQLVYRNNSPNALNELYFHLYLNAFRPGSLWSADERREGIHRFADLKDPYNAFEQLRAVRVGGADLAIGYPNAPDSTVAHVRLPRPLAPGDSLVVELEWLARPSVIPRRQGRSGRRFDFAQWYPKVCVYDRNGWQAHPLRLAGELYGEYGTYDVTLDLAEDQVVAATGLPVAGDPGWAGARATPETPVTLQADWYGPRSRPRVMDWQNGLEPGRRRVRFYAEHIHHFAFSLNPAYRYEEGRYGDVVLRALYLPSDSAAWGGGKVIERTARAMAWLDTIFGAYVYPQTVVLHRIEGGGTEFPMLVMNGGPEESLIFHEVGHIYTYGILGNNEWKEAWLDEGFTTFQTAWNFQRRGMGVPSTLTQQLVLGLDLDRWSEPVSQVSEDYAEFQVYNRMVYTKAQLVYEMLRYQVGEEAFRRGLRLYYQRWQLKHVDEDAFRSAMEEASGQDLHAFFAQWLHHVPRVDYRIRSVTREHLENGSWRTTVDVERRGLAVMPVVVAVPAGDTVYTARTDGVRHIEVVQVTTPVRSGKVELDPARQTMDWNYLNNREDLRVLGLGGASGPQAVHRLGWSSTQPARRDRVVNNWLPVAWYTDAGGVTLGVQNRTNYLGRYRQYTALVAHPMDDGGSFPVYLSVRNPEWLTGPRFHWGFGAWYAMDGRSGFQLDADADLSPHLSRGPRVALGGFLRAMSVRNSVYLDSALWTNATTWELGGWWSSRWSGDRTGSGLRAEGLFGLAGKSTQAGVTAPRTYLRGSLELKHHRPLGPLDVRGRLWAGGVLSLGEKDHATNGVSTDSVPVQRRFFLAGADPYQTFGNPFLRSAGALFVKPDVNYSAPGGAGVRGLGAALYGDAAVAGSLELSQTLFSSRRRVFSSLALALFGDAALTGQAFTARTGFDNFLADAGAGVRATHRIGPTRFVTRVDFPILVNEPAAAVGARPGDGRTKFRFVWSLEEAF